MCQGSRGGFVEGERIELCSGGWVFRMGDSRKGGNDRSVKMGMGLLCSEVWVRKPEEYGPTWAQHHTG